MPWHCCSCSPLVPLFQEARCEGEDIPSACPLPSHHDAHIGSPHAPLHHIFQGGELLPIHPVDAIHRAAVYGVLLNPPRTTSQAGQGWVQFFRAYSLVVLYGDVV